MKKFLLFSIFTALVAIPAMASVSPEQYTDAEYLMNSGYSQLTAEDVFMSKNRIAGKPVEPLYEKDKNVLVRGWRTFWGYIDPANDEFDRLHHNIKPGPAFSDL